jgi:CCR4-NOT transcription complex subunit 1
VPKSPAQGGGQPGGPPSGGGAGEQGNAPPAAALDKVVSELNAAISTCGNVRDLQSLPPTHEIHNFIREIQSVVQQSRGEAVPPLTRKFVAALFNNDAPSIKRDIYFNLLAHFNDAYRGAAGQEATKTYIISQDERKYDAVVVSRLLASRLLIPSELDNYFVKASDMGKNFRVVGFAEEVLRHCFLGQVARHLNVTDFGQTIDMIAHLARKSQPQPRTVELLEVLIKQRQASARAGGQAGGPPGGRAPVSAVMEEPGDPQGLKESVGMHFEEWLRLVRQPTATKGEKADVMFISRLLQQGMLRTDDISTRFFRLSTDFAVHVFMSTAAAQGPDAANDVTSGAYNGIDAFSKLIVVLLKHFGESTKVALLNKVLTTIITVLTRDHKRLQHQFNQKPFFRLLCNLLFEVHTAEDSVTFQVLNAFSHAFHLLRPAVVPAFAFGWLELVSHRQFMPKLLLMKDPKGWQMLQRLLVDLFSYMAPFLRGGEMHPAVRTLYKGTLRMLLVLLHDFPEFLADHHFSLCDVIPVTCVQMRNLILSAFPRNMRLPDPFTPNLNVDHLPESSQPPRVLSNVARVGSEQLARRFGQLHAAAGPATICQTVALPDGCAVACRQ